MLRASSLTATMTDGFAATGVGIWTATVWSIYETGQSMQDVDELAVGTEMWLQCPATCIICSHKWRFVMPVTVIEVDGIAVADVPDKVECPSCGGMYGEPEV